MRKKLKQQKGETLAETLVALLIATLSVMMLTAALTGTSRLNKQNRDADLRYREDLKRAESYETDADNEVKEVEIRFDFGGGVHYIKDALLYGGTEGKLASYKAKEEDEE